MPEHETPSLFDQPDGAPVPEAPRPDPRSDLRREIIDPGIAEGRMMHQAAQGGRLREPAEPNTIQSDLGYNDDVAEEPLPDVVTKGWSSLLGRLVENDRDVELQQAIVDRMRRNRERRARERMDQTDRQRALDHLAHIQDITDPDGSKRAREASRQAAIQADAARRSQPPPDISRSA